MPQRPFDLTAMGQALNSNGDSALRPMVPPFLSGAEILASGKGKGKVDDWAVDFMQEAASMGRNAEPMNLQAREMVPPQPCMFII